MHEKRFGSKIKSHNISSNKREIFGIYSYAVNIPLLKIKPNSFFFDSVGSGSSKSGIAFREMSQWVLGRNDRRLKIGSEKTGKNYFFRIIRFIYQRLLLISLHRRVKKSKLDEFEKKVIISYAAFNLFFKNNARVYPVIISDTSVNYLIMAYAADENSGAFWWQDDYHHKQKPRFKVIGAALLSQSLYADYRKTHKQDMLLLRNVSSTKKVKFPQIISSVGVAVNGSFTGNKLEINKLMQILKITHSEAIEVRLHPTSHKNFPLPTWIKISRMDESIDQFALRHNLIFVGNSAAQIKILKEGVPVVHTSDLDDNGYDLYEYVKNSVVYGSRSLHRTLIADVREFYGNNVYYEKLEQIVTGGINN